MNLKPPRSRRTKYSVVIPVFNSASLVGETVDRTAAFLKSQGLDYEIILVNDGSRDGSWDVIRSKALANPRLKAINLLRNYGQHNANLCGFRHTKGDYVITMDDDGQNPPEEIAKLVRKAAEGHDLVFGKFKTKAAPFYRAWGSRAIGLLNRRVFHQPRDLTVSNFRILRRDVVDRICAYRAAFPYITGLALMNSKDRANVEVRHEPRRVGKSNYSALRIAKLVMTILFSYSSFPLRFLAGVGLAVSVGSFLTGLVFLAQGLRHEVQVPGWTTVVVLLSFLNGMTILMLSMLGEYVVRILNQSSNIETYNVTDVVTAP
ncbi:MAG TPA: glycosyltransferase family 2 protein [bacterium]|nr:glycosyltransferase family 2 protein [bacterium]